MIKGRQLLEGRFIVNTKYLAALFVFIAFGLQFLSVKLLNYASLFFIVATMLACCFIYGVPYKSIVSWLVLTFLLLCFMCVSSYFVNTLALGVYVSILACTLLSAIILRHDHNFFVLKSLYHFLFVLVVVVCCALMSGINPDELWPQSSRNTTSEVFVVLGSIFLINGRVLRNLRFKPLFYLLIVIVSVMSFGRSGIISSFILFAAFALYSVRAFRKSRILYLFLVGATLIFLFSGKFFSYFEYLEAKGIADSYRLNMIKEFASNYGISIFIFGVDFSSLPYIAGFNSNPHNAYISLHGNLGIVAIFLFLGVFLCLLRLVLNRQYVALIALVAMLLRLATDEASGLILLPLVYTSVDGFSYLLRSIPRSRWGTV